MAPAPFVSSFPNAVQTFPGTRANLTHYYAMKEDGQWIAIGEAELVQESGPNKWEARLVQWGVDRAKGQPDPAQALALGWSVVQGPDFALFPKEHFPGIVPG